MMDPRDRPIWSALTNDQAHLQVRNGRAMRYRSDYAAFIVGEDHSPAVLDDMAELVERGETASLLEAEPLVAPGGLTTRHVAVTQLVATEFPEPKRACEYRELSEADAVQMLELALLTKPGPFRTRTHQLGPFYGVFDGEKLVAMGGARMKMGDFVEISAICTHPDYRGKGYGAAMITAVGKRLQAEGLRPFLHSNADNEVALALYHSLGFRDRKDFWHSVWEKPE